MSEAPARTDGDLDEDRVRKRTAELLYSNERLREQVQRLSRERDELERRLQAAALGSLADRETRRAALNLMEDADLARRRALAINAELQKEVDERRRIEHDLRESDRQLHLALDRHRQLNADLDRRVQERTAELRQREERLRELTTQLDRAERRERQRLARVLHDQVQQLLVAAKMQVDLAAHEPGDPRPARLAAALTILDDAIHATRNLAVQLAPPLLHDQGLPAALEWLVFRLTRQHGLAIDARIDADVNPASEEVREVLFQAGQEFLLNAAKHARTAGVVLELARAAGRVSLTVQDVGVGLDPATALDGRGSFGLFQVRQRLESVGGTLTLRATPGRGTTAVAAVPSSPPDPPTL